MAGSGELSRSLDRVITSKEELTTRGATLEQMCLCAQGFSSSQGMSSSSFIDYLQLCEQSSLQYTPHDFDDVCRVLQKICEIDLNKLQLVLSKL